MSRHGGWMDSFFHSCAVTKEINHSKQDDRVSNFLVLDGNENLIIYFLWPYQVVQCFFKIT